MEKERRGTFRQRFFIDLRAGETNVISWKKLLNKRVVTSTVEEPQAQAQAQAQDCIGDSKLQKSDLPPPGNRFSAVIERIEHLYRGDSSSHEEKLDDVPDDDQYDTEDSFIDDEELDEYFSVEKSKTKHSGFFINRGKLERVNEPAPSLVRAPKKFKKKYIKKTPVDRCIERMPVKLPKIGSVCIKAAARSVPLATLKNSNSVWDRTLFAGGDSLVHKPSYDQDVEVIQSQGSTFGFGPCKIDKYKRISNNEEASITVEVSHKNSAKNSAVKDERKPKGVLVRSKDNLVKGAKLLEINDSMNSTKSEKNICRNADSQIRKSNKDASVMTTSSQYKITEKEDVDLRDVNSLGNKLLPSKIAHGTGTTKQRKKLLSSAPKEDSIGRPKDSMLERSFQDLEKSVAELYPTMINIQEKDWSSQGAKRRLPTLVKQKLAKVAILAMNQGKLSNLLIDRLVNIVGHTIQLKILKVSKITFTPVNIEL
ncbi:ubinuclein-1 [Cryptomeria japonica]|uniref:ubinuclein-1 n=1 Tax=Cryptomeria japonica TaxID=3369 RepID=UPI0027DA874E|nr:ubinuclein-1 [Cryptomeria japonica]